MGVVDGPKLLRPATRRADGLRRIRLSWRGQSNHIAGIDVLILIVSAIRTKGSLEELNMIPRVPVMTVVYYFRDYCLVLKRNGFDPILVFDGARNPLKKDTNEKRYRHLADDTAKLLAMYADEESTLSGVIEQQKKTCQVREDVLFEVMAMAEREGFRFIGSPFKADSQLIALMNQGVID